MRVGLAWSRITGEPSAYARRTMLNLFLNERRKRRRETLVPAVADRPVDDHAATDQVVALDAAKTLLRQLPDGQRAAVAMRYVLGLDDDRIADALGCTSSTVRSQIARGLTTLRGQHAAPSASGPEKDH